MKQIVWVLMIGLAAGSADVIAQNGPIFPKGEKAPNVTQYVGTIWRTQLNTADSIFTYGTSTVTYEPGARLNWHSHPGGQMLLITEGTGYYQERGKAKQTIRRGEVIKCVPDVEHWHGATPSSGVSYIAITPAQKGPTIWLQRVSDTEYTSKN